MCAVSIIAGIFIFWLFISEFLYYLQIETQPQLLVDTTRGEKLRINFDVTFPRLPCARTIFSILNILLVVSVDSMDISGEHQLEVDHNVFKKRLDLTGRELSDKPVKQNGILICNSNIPRSWD